MRASQVVLRQRIHMPMPELQETWVQSLGQKDYPEKEMATHSTILSGLIPRPEESAGLQSVGQRVRHS